MLSSKNDVSRLIYIILFIGVAISLFLLYEHFSPTGSEICNISEQLNCDTVNKSPYSTADGIIYLLVFDLGISFPYVDIAGMNVLFEFILTNAFLGFVTLLFTLFLYRSYENKRDFLWIKKDKSSDWLKGITLFSVLYGGYLFLVQHFILRTYCVFCLSLDLILIILAIFVWTRRQ